MIAWATAWMYHLNFDGMSDVTSEPVKNHEWDLNIMATKKGSKKKTKAAEEPVEETPVVEEPPVEEPPAPKETKKATKAKELADHVGWGGSAADYVKHAHEVLLDRDATEGEIAYYAGLVDTHGFQLNEIIHQMKKSGEYQGKHGTFL